MLAYRTYRLTISAGVVTRYQSNTLCLHLYVHGHGYSMTHQEITPKESESLNVYRDIVDLRCGTLGRCNRYVCVISATDCRLPVFLYPLSLFSPLHCVIPFNTVIMVPICALYIYYICVNARTILINVRLQQRERERGLADKKRMAWFTIEAQTIIKIIRIITKCVRPTANTVYKYL